MKISEIDKNFKIETKIQKPQIAFFDAKSSPIEIDGVFYENGAFRRMPEKIAKSVSEGVYWLHSNTAGGRIRFRTDSPYVAISAKMPSVCKMSHFPISGSAGYDLYADNEYAGSFIPPFDVDASYEGVVELKGRKMREITVNMPTYSGVCELYIGLDNTSSIQAPTPYKIEKPIVFYGSSITQGGCSSRPGNTYQAIVSRALDANYINLGFSGNARAEDEMSDYVKNLDMSAFVYDYDHNAPTLEHLCKTHEKMFKAIREQNPTLPIVIMSRPKYTLTADEKKRLAVIKQTYENALASGDKNVYLITGRELMKIAKNDGTVDNCHPNDLGFYSMAKSLLKVLKQIFKEEK